MNISRRDVIKNGVWVSPAILAAVNVPAADAFRSMPFEAMQTSYNFEHHSGVVSFQLKNVKPLAGHTFTVTTDDVYKSALCTENFRNCIATPGKYGLISKSYTTDAEGKIHVGWLQGNTDRKEVLHAVGSIRGARKSAFAYIYPPQT